MHLNVIVVKFIFVSTCYTFCTTLLCKMVVTRKKYKKLTNIILHTGVNVECFYVKYTMNNNFPKID